MTARIKVPRSGFRSSIRWRFTLWISAVLFVSIGVSFAIIYRDTTNRLEAQIEHDLRADSAQLAQSLELIGRHSHRSVLAAAQQYVGGQSFRSISRLLFVLAGGRGGVPPISNYPELFSFSTPDNEEGRRQQAAENARTQRLRQPIPGLSTQDVADIGDVRLLERTINVGGLRLTIGAGESLETVNRAQRGVVESFLLAGGFMTLAVLLGSYVVGSRVTAPLRRMARVAARVGAGDLEPRIIESRPLRNDEVGVLAGAFNHMLQRLDDAFRAQREFVADASHELRTPLTVIQGQLEVLSARREVDRDELKRVERLVHGEIQRMRRIVDDLLLLARTESRDFLQLEPVDLGRFLAQLRDDATLIAERRFELGGRDAIPGGRLLADPDRLAQALRNLINNAIDHTVPGTGLVRIEVERADGDRVRISVIDDGPGIPAGELDRIFQRFHRTGEARAGGGSAGRDPIGGSGLGLAIVRALAEAHGGSAEASNRDAGIGARFDLWLPGFTPAPGAAQLAPPARLPEPTAPGD
ncbi:MAG: sensor histidine kinase [Solirubrobacteraceae bacterium]